MEGQTVAHGGPSREEARRDGCVENLGRENGLAHLSPFGVAFSYTYFSGRDLNLPLKSEDVVAWS